MGREVNAKQQAIFDEAKAAGGRLWVESTLNMHLRGGHSSSGYGRMNAVMSMVSEQEKGYVSGGFKRDVRFRIIEEQEVRRWVRNDPKCSSQLINRVLVELL